MAVNGINANYNNNATLTVLNAWLSANCADVYSSNSPFFARMRAAGRIKTGGIGYTWSEPFYYPVTTGPQLQGVSDMWADQVRPTETGGISQLQFTPAMFIMNVGIAKYDLKAQGSDTKRVDYLQTIMKISNTKWGETLNSQLWAAEGATGADGQSKAVLGSLRAYINGGGSSTTDGGATPARSASSFGGTFTAVGTSAITKIGNVERNGVGGAYFCPNLYNKSGGDAATAMALNNLITYAARNEDRPTLILLPPRLYTYYLGIVQSQQRTDLKTYGKYEGFTWNGVDVMYDDNVPAGTDNGASANTTGQIFCLNLDHLTLRYDTMKPQFTPYVDPLRTTLDNYTASQIIQLTTDHPGRVHSRNANVLYP
jgi:hypothetical protein